MGAWIETSMRSIGPNPRLVAPYVGAWIETERKKGSERSKWSHPTWVRGLKLKAIDFQPVDIYVAPYVGAWIETNNYKYL